MILDFILSAGVLYGKDTMYMKVETIADDVVKAGVTFTVLNHSVVVGTGATGPQGLTGVGFIGTDGVTGPKGDTGAQGITGPAGGSASGVLGITGPQGVTGVGFIGTDGVTGPKGTTGVQGVTGGGLQGSTGLVGATGASYGQTGMITMLVNGFGYSILTGIQGDMVLPTRCKIDKWTLFANPTGSVTSQLQLGNYTNYPPTTIMHAGATGPFINLGIKNNDSTNGWGSPTGAAYDLIRYSINSVTGIQSLCLQLDYSRF
jgi:hypothetical protein